MKNPTAIYITTFPPQRYRRPLFAARALKKLGLETKLIDGWKIIDSMKPLKILSNLVSKLPQPINWLSRDLIYETGLLASLFKEDHVAWLNLNTLGTLSITTIKPAHAPLILDMQDVTIEDNGTLPLYDQTMLRQADLVIFASKALKKLVEKQHPKTIKKATYIPFGIDLKTFDLSWMKALSTSFKDFYGIRDKVILTYSGAAYLWGEREGQGLELLAAAISKIVRSIPNVKCIIQGAAETGTYLHKWIERLIKKNGIENCTLLLPPMSPHNPLRLSLLRESTILLLPIGYILGTYFAEQQKIFEYMASKRPIAMVATPARLNVLDDKSAYISYSRDPEEFASVIIQAIQNLEEAEAKAIEARKIVERKYSWEVLEPLYADAVSKVVLIK